MAATSSRGRTVPNRCARGLLIGALFAAACNAPSDSQRRPPPTAPLEAIAPAGNVAYPITFRWNGNTQNGVVHVSIEDRAQRPVFAFPARGNSVPAPEGLSAVLRPGEPFSWSVAAVDENGETSRVSKPVQFSVK